MVGYYICPTCGAKTRATTLIPFAAVHCDMCFAVLAERTKPNEVTQRATLFVESFSSEAVS